VCIRGASGVAGGQPVSRGVGSNILPRTAGQVGDPEVRLRGHDLIPGVLK
jgi:hypothetical protein